MAKNTAKSDNLLSCGLSTPLGPMRATATEKGITSLEFSSSLRSTAPTGVLSKLSTQLDQYFAGKRRDFDLPIDWSAVSTDFGRKSLRTIAKIPYGEVLTYTQVAREMGKPTAARAVGNAMGRNPICLILPCHRVVASKGIGGYAGRVDRKKKLLKLEGYL